MYITFLGTSSGAPSRSRNVSATAVQSERGRAWLLVDCGEATQHQLLYTPLSPQKLAGVLITHIHGDHCYGLPGLLASCQLNGRTAPLTLVGPAAVWDYLQAVIRFTALRIDYPLQFIDVAGLDSLKLAGFEISAHPLSHRVPSWAYRFLEADIGNRLLVDKLQAEGVESGPHYGELQQGRDVRLADGRQLRSTDFTVPARMPQSVVIGGDNDRPELLAEACAAAELLVHEATYTDEVLQQIGDGPQHSSARRVAEFAEQVGLAHLILTHFSPRYQFALVKANDRSIDEVSLEARACYRGDLWLARDFDRFRLTPDGQLLRENLRWPD
ncbi:MBL fold metallo-hydrolase [Marinobacterium arenosum]|uniref:MBL fold metallo-hydrolase n=1 Tax=Marinobacterium arenosum TaxID=2862496 RepID=UPI001C985067|nr:MBL fold metallo-hydrolase [Marinobacterium arenosum]MBY4676825.1 MBL fold metallo-hydrolase [Marinobacterium arenosum]